MSQASDYGVSMPAEAVDRDKRPATCARVAVVGTGIAGLSAAHALGKVCDVTLFERLPSLGMSAHAWSAGDAELQVDVPIRVMYPDYYPRLLALLAEAGVATAPVDGSSSFSFADGSTYFSYRNLQWRARALPLPSASPQWALSAGRIALDYLRFLRAADSVELPRQMTLREFLDRGRYSNSFRQQFVLPVFATICTCTNAQLLDAPASVILGYASGGLRPSTLQRAVGGARSIATRLAAGCADVQCGAEVEWIRRAAEGVLVRRRGAEAAQCFDHVLVATQANHALRLVEGLSAAARKALQGIEYTPVDVLLHSDPRLMPARPRSWAPANYFIDDAWSRPMATLWVNRVYPALRTEDNVFQTVAPEMAPRDDSIISAVGFERPLVTPDSLDSVAALDRVQRDPDRRIWFCGSYAQPGVPLLESGASSGLDLAARILDQIEATGAQGKPHVPRASGDLASR